MSSLSESGDREGAGVMRGRGERTVALLIASVALPLLAGWSDPAAAQQPPQADPRAPVPAQAVQAEVLKKMGEIFDFAAAQKPEQRIELARELLRLAKESKSKPDEEFVLLRKAAELASDGGDAGLMAEAVDSMGERFQINPLDAKVAMLLKLAGNAKTAESIAALVKGAGGSLRQAVQEHRYDVALQLAEALYAAAQRTAGSKHRKPLLDAVNKLRALNGQYQEYRKSLAAVESNPADPDANAAVGRWRCFVENDWERGLPCLAAGADPELKDSAARELNVPAGSAPELVKAGDGWWDLAEKKTGPEKLPTMRHAATCYEKAQSQGLTGLLKLKVEKRLKDAEDAAAAAAKSDVAISLDPGDGGSKSRGGGPRGKEKTSTQGGTATGILAYKGDAWIAVQIEGEKDVVGYTIAPPEGQAGQEAVQALQAAIKALVIPNLVEVTGTQQGDKRTLTSVKMIVPTSTSGVVQGTVVGKEKNTIDVKPDREGPVERYSPQWIGGMPNEGGGPDKNALQAISEVQVGDKVQVQWLYEQRKRIVQIAPARPGARVRPDQPPAPRLPATSARPGARVRPDR